MTPTPEALKPCPFCGETEISRQTGLPDREGTPFNMACEACGACGPVEMTEAAAIAAWNRRTQEGE